MLGARKRGLIRQKLEIITFFPLFYFYLDPNVSLKQQKNSTFLSIRESLRREKFYFGRFAKVYAREMQKFREFMLLKYFIRRNFRESKNSRIFLDKLSRFDKSKKFREINFREWRNWKDFAR